ncbi:MAG: ACT domain-containing protein [Desulfovibrio sp.]|jgi:hypothetical protein|nr:ACT domain-containing protein [Desulfovibrio sp.]
MTIDQLSIFVENKPGHLMEITETLGNAGIDLRALSIGDTAEFGVLRLIVNDPGKALDILHDAGFVVSITQVLAVSLNDTPGSLGKILRVIANAGINIEYMYAFVTQKSVGAYAVFRVEDNDAALADLRRHGVDTVSLNDTL